MTQTYSINWISIPGIPECDIEITVRDGRAYATRETMKTMAESIRTSGIASEEEDAAYADDILTTPETEFGDFDITDFAALEDQLIMLAEDEGLPPFRITARMAAR